MSDVAQQSSNTAAKRAVTVAVVGNVLEWYDFAVYGFLAAIIGKNFFPSADETTQLLASFFLAVIFAVLLLVRDRKLFEGGVFLSYVVLYSLFRFIIEFYRTDPRGFFLFFSTSRRRFSTVF